MKKQELIKLLKPFWKEYENILGNHFNKVKLLEIKMNNMADKKNLPRLEFFYVDGEVVGIGAENYLDRKKFPLLHNSDLN